MPEAKATTKQAKAAFKTRTEQPLTEREQKQLERSIQLDRRAWGLREREKNRADLAKKRAAQERAQRDEERRLGTQRRFDKHGFKSSQFHLGAFFRKPAPVARPDAAEVKAEVVGPTAASEPDHGKTIDHTRKDDVDPQDEDEDEFDDVDDESLLEALRSPEVARTSATFGAPVKPNTSMPPPPRPNIAKAPAQQAPMIQAHKPEETDMEWFDDFESSTQIAREISTNSTTADPLPPAAVPKEPVRSTSFSSGSFDLTEDDIEQLDPTPRAAHTNDGHRTNHEQTKASAERSMPPPPLPLTRTRQQPVIKDQAHASITPNATKHTPVREELEFSMTQLESFMEDDLELTQTY